MADMQEHHEHVETQQIPVKIYRSEHRVTVAAPLPGLQAEDITVEVTPQGHRILDGDLRGALKGVKELLVDEWSVGGYHRHLKLPMPVDGQAGNVTYGNGVLVVVLPISDQVRPPARLTLTRTNTGRGERVGSSGQALERPTTSVHRSAMAEEAHRHGSASDPHDQPYSEKGI
jgi:HSP20 family protein